MFKFKILKSTILPQVKFIEYSSYKDNRGFIFSIYDKEIEKKLIKFTKKKFTHDKIVFRKKNILTGIHGDKKTWKLISCLRGKIYQVVVNCNEKSKNFGKYFSCFLNGKDCKSILIPPNSFVRVLPSKETLLILGVIPSLLFLSFKNPEKLRKSN